MISYNSQVTKGDYKIQIQTDNYEHYRMIEKMVQLMIDKDFAEKQLPQYDGQVTHSVQNPVGINIKWPNTGHSISTSKGEN